MRPPHANLTRPHGHHPAKLDLFLLALAITLAALTPGATHAATINVPAGGNLQEALNNALPGDEVVLEAGATFIGNFVLPVKSGASYITVRSSRCAELPAGARVRLDHGSLMARLATPNVAAVLEAPVNSHHWRLQCLEVTQGPTVGEYGYNLIALGDGDASGPQTSLALVPHHFEIDRCIIRARDAQTAAHRGVSLNSAHTTIRNSHISGIKWAGNETQAVAGWNGPGPFLIENNYLEAAGIQILFGGAPPAITGLVPSDIEIRRNHFFKPLSWRIGDPAYAGTPWTVKNLLELKNARRIRVEGNVMENNWPHAQTGWAFIINAGGDSGPANVVEDLEFVNNILRNVANGLNLRGMEDGDTATRMKRIRFSNNLLEKVGVYEGEGKVFQLLQSSESVAFDHNTVTSAGALFVLLDTMGNFKHVGCSFTNNVAPHGAHGVLSDGGAYGANALDTRCGVGSWTFARNLVAGADPTRFPFPSNNYYPPAADFDDQFADHANGDYRLATTSCGSAASGCNPKGATDGKDAGVDFVALNAATAGAVSGLWSDNLAQGKPATQSSTGAGGVAARAVDGNTSGNWADNSVTHTAIESQPWWQVDLGGVHPVRRIDVWNRTDCCSERLSNFYVFVSDVPFTSTSVAATLVQPGVSSYHVPGQAGATTSFTINRSAHYVRVQLNGTDFLSLAEVQVWGGTPNTRTNVALASNGGVTTASTEHASGNFPASGVNNGDRKGLNWGAGGGWNDNTENIYPDWVEVAFGGTKSISEINVFTLQDNLQSPAEPTEAMTFSQFGATAFDVQYWDGFQWVTVPGGSVSGSNLVWRRFTFAPVATTKVRVLVTSALAGHSRLVEVEAY